MKVDDEPGFVPHTLAVLKKLAKAEVKNTGVKHATALEIVAERYGFIDFDDARKRLPP